MADRKAELAAKKERLRQMREEKERRKREKERQDAENAARSLRGESATKSESGASSDASGARSTIDIAEVDKILTDYGIAPVSKVCIGILCLIIYNDDFTIVCIYLHQIRKYFVDFLTGIIFFCI